MGKLDGKIALITGGSEGIGLAVAQAFLQEGSAHVFNTGRRQKALDAAVKKLDSERVAAFQNDTSNLDDLNTLYDVIRKQQGHLDILFVNAGMYEVAELGSINEKHYDILINTNVKAVLFTVQKLLPIFVDGGSTEGFLNDSIYCAAKAALRSFARCWTVDLKERKIRINTLSFEPIETPLLKSIVSTEEEMILIQNALKDLTVLDHIAIPDEIAKAAVFLASNDSSYITGIELFVDGGLS